MKELSKCQHVMFMSFATNKKQRIKWCCICGFLCLENGNWIEKKEHWCYEFEESKKKGLLKKKRFTQ